MSVTGITGPSAQSVASSASPSDALTELLLVLRQARQAHNTTERAFSDAAIGSAEAMARHATDKAEASRKSALLQFCIGAGQALSSFATLAVDAASARPGESAEQGEPTQGESSETEGSDESHREERSANQLVNDIVGPISELAESADVAFGFSRQADELKSHMERAQTQQTRFQAYESRARAVGDELDDAISEIRQTLREVSSGGQS